jgi:hypothetical protein
VVAAVALVWVVGCRGPAGFWAGYRASAIVDRASDQGPWGGWRWIAWEAPADDPFAADHVLSYATAQGWRCEAATRYTPEELAKWVVRGKLVFPLTYDELDEQLTLRMSRRITGESYVYRCQTGWMRVEPGSDKTSEAYGYIHLSADGRQLAIYHDWGE